jgi:hypothetical protein
MNSVVTEASRLILSKWTVFRKISETMNGYINYMNKCMNSCSKLNLGVITLCSLLICTCMFSECIIQLLTSL